MDDDEEQEEEDIDDELEEEDDDDDEASSDDVFEKPPIFTLSCDLFDLALASTIAIDRPANDLINGKLSIACLVSIS